jgi:teichuronic acid biosynthesis glycosyltransferase TuaC
MSNLQVLIVSNHEEAKKTCLHAGVFVDRQCESLKKFGVNIITFDIGTSHSPILLIKRWLELRRLVRKLNPDLVHGAYGTIVGMMSVFAGRPAVISFCGGDLQHGASVSYVRLLIGFFLSNLAALRAERLICKSEQLVQALWWRKKKAVIIPNGVDLDLFSPGSQSESRKKLGWDVGHPIVIFNGGSDPKGKGIDLAQEAMKFARSRVPNAVFHVLSNEEPLRMPLYYRAADALLCTSITEGSPNVVKEALACNLPVVSTAVGDVPERLAGVCPSEVVSRDPKEIGEAISNVLEAKQRSNGRDKVMHLSLDQVALRVLDVYKSIRNTKKSLTPQSSLSRYQDPTS